MLHVSHWFWCLFCFIIFEGFNFWRWGGGGSGLNVGGTPFSRNWNAFSFNVLCTHYKGTCMENGKVNVFLM